MLFKAILNASKVGSHFSFYDCACVVTITVSLPIILTRTYFFRQIRGVNAGATGFDPQPHVQDLTSGWWAAVAEDIRTPVSAKNAAKPRFPPKIG
jgi:hypothetical protein